MNKLLKGAVFLGLGWLAVSAIKKRKAAGGASDYPVPLPPANEVPTPMPVFVPPAEVIVKDGWAGSGGTSTKGGFVLADNFQNSYFKN